MTGLDSTPPSQEPRPELSVPTRFSEEVELIFKVAEKGLEAGNPQNAESMVREHLRNLLEDAATARRVPGRARSTTHQPTGRGGPTQECRDTASPVCRANRAD